MGKIKFGIIGCGKIGLRHIDFLKKNIDAEISAVCDIIKERANIAAQKANSKYYIDYEEMINNEKFDIINICTPNGLHAKMAVDCINNENNDLVEKPMALKVKDAKKMIETAKENEKHLFVVKQNRQNKPIKILRDAIDKGNFGKIYMISCNVFWNRAQEYFNEEAWRGTLEFDGGALFTQASHFVDLILLIGGKPKSVFAQMDNFTHDIETEDTGTVIIRFENNAIATINYTNCIYDKNLEGSLTILGTKGTVKIGGEYLNKIEFWNVEGYPLPQDNEEKSPANDYGSYRGSASKHDEVFKEIIGVLRGKPGYNKVDGFEGIKTVELIEAAKLSVKTGKEVIL